MDSVKVDSILRAARSFSLTKQADFVDDITLHNSGRVASGAALLLSVVARQGFRLISNYSAHLDPQEGEHWTVHMYSKFVDRQTAYFDLRWKSLFRPIGRDDVSFWHS